MSKLARISVASLVAVVLIVGCVNVANLISLGTQLAVDIISVIGAFQGRADAADISTAQAIGAEAQKDWSLVSAAYTAYEANKSASNLQNVVNAAAVLENNLAALLASAHIKDAVLAARVTAAVETIITVVDQVAVDLGATVPATPAAHALAHRLGANANVKAQVSSVKSIWNSTVVQPTGDAAVDAALAKARL